MLKNTLIALGIGICLVVFLTLSYLSFMCLYTDVQLAFIRGQVAVFEYMEEQVKTAKTVECAVGSMEYAFYYYAGGQLNLIDGTAAETLLETLRRNSVRRMAITLNERFPESSKGDSPAAWMEAYGDKSRLDGTRNDDRWYKYYKEWYNLSPDDPFYRR